MIRPETQLAAWRDLQPSLGERQLAVVLAVDRAGPTGATLFELVEVLGWPVNRISGLVTELATAEVLVDSGLRRENPRSGKRGIVWVTVRNLAAARPSIDRRSFVAMDLWT